MSTLRANTVANAAGTGPVTLTGQWAAKAILRYDQNTPAVDRAENVTSVTDDAAGAFTINLTNSFDAADYSVVGSCGDVDVASGFFRSPDLASLLTSAVDAATISGGGATRADYDKDSVSIFGDLA